MVSLRREFDLVRRKCRNNVRPQERDGRMPIPEYPTSERAASDCARHQDTIPGRNVMAQTVDKHVVEKAEEHAWPHQLPRVDVGENHGHAGLASAKGSTIVDVDGKEYLDGISGLWVVNAGHGREEIAEAIGEQAKKLAYVSSVQYTTEPTAHLGHKLAEIMPGDLSRAYFCSG